MPQAADTREAGTRETVIVTGSSGFLGRAIARRLARSYRVFGFDFTVPEDKLPGVEPVQLDLTKDDSVADAVRTVVDRAGPAIASVVHLAAYYDLSGDENPKYDAVTVEGSRRLMRCLQDLAVGQFILASTLLVHRPTLPGRPIDEDWPIDPKSAYPASKARTEAALSAEHGDIPLVLLRPAGVYDEMCRAAFLAQQIANIHERQVISHLYPGELDHGQPYLHLDDLVDAIARIVDRRDRLPGETALLLGERETLSYDQLQRLFGRLIHDEEWETRTVPKAMAKAGQWLQEDVLDIDPFVQPWMIDRADDHYEVDTTRAEQLLDWRPRHRLEATIPAMIAALKKDPAAWYAANKLNAEAVAAAKVEEAPPERLAPGERRDVEARRREDHRATRWAPFLVAMLGLWLLASPFTLGLFDPGDVTPVPPAAGRVLAEPDVRDGWLAWSDLACGLLLVLFGALALRLRHGWARWATAAVGTWLLFAPLVFWTGSAAAYANDTIIGALSILLATCWSNPPGIASVALKSDADVPLGWSYSPSSYSQRVPIVVLAFVGFLLSRYMAAFQLGHVDAAWDPVFGDGTETVVTSELSRAWPIADAGMGAAVYLIEALTGLIGDRRRWRTMPWLVLGFGLLIVPLGAVSIGFIIIQPVLIGTWCGICLATAVVSVLMIPYALDELLATTQFLLRARRAGRPLWRTFWKGGDSLPGGKREARPDIDAPVGEMLRAFLLGGVSFPWTLAASIAVGVVLMATRLLAGTEGALADSDHVAGCLVITVAVTALAEIARPVRFLNLPIGAWLVAAPFVLDGGGVASAAVGIVAGLLLILLSLPRGRLSGEHYGGWDKAIV
ncbi:vitamin K epoxide reductase [Allostella vacuolata]|nr:vitamin K epoxide reductase [Stella vacuolata]